MRNVYCVQKNIIIILIYKFNIIMLNTNDEIICKDRICRDKSNMSCMITENKISCNKTKGRDR